MFSDKSLKGRKKKTRKKSHRRNTVIDFFAAALQ